MSVLLLQSHITSQSHVSGLTTNIIREILLSSLDCELGVYSFYEGVDRIVDDKR